MRSQLAPLLGQRVRLCGAVGTWKDNGLMLVNVQIAPYRSEGEFVVVDHLWSWGTPVSKIKEYLENDYEFKFQRFASLLSMATVVQYTRKDKTQDYGIEVFEVPSIDLDFVWDCAAKCSTSKEAIEEVVAAKLALDEDLLAFNPEYRYSDVRGGIDWYHELATRSYLAQQQRLASQVRYPVRRDPTIPGKKLAIAKGFG